MKKKVFYIILSLIIFSLAAIYPTPVKVLAQAAGSGLGAVVGGLILRIPNLAPEESSTFYFLAGSRPLSDSGYIAGQIKSIIKDEDRNPATPIDKLNSILEIRGTQDSTPNTGIKILPDGSVVMGGVSNREVRNPLPPTNDIPKDLPPGFDELAMNHRSSGVYDFFLSMPTKGDEKARSGLFVRNLVVHDMGDPVDLVIKRSQGNKAGDQVRYGVPQAVNPNESLGTIKWSAQGVNGSAGVNAFIYARNEDWGEEGYFPGSLFLGTSSKDKPSKNHIAISIRDTGNVGVGDGETNPQAKLHVFGDLMVSGAKNFMIDHPTKPGMKLVHSSLEGPENAVFYRGEGQLVNGAAIIELPEYFEKLTRSQDRTVQLTPKFETDTEPISALAYSEVKDGKFKVRAMDKNNPYQKFSWEVKAIRDDILALEVEREK